MPRIDPAKLLKTLSVLLGPHGGIKSEDENPAKLHKNLSVLLGPHGGIKSEDEVSRLVTLMEKFSEKLVSKVVYIKILLATNPEILDKFLRERGWDLLNFWFAEGIRSSNWPLCNQIVQLFLLSPMTAERLRENSDQNRAPKLVRQLTYDSRVDDTLRDLSNQAFSEFLEALKENYTRLYDILHQADEDSASQAPAAAPIRPPTPCTNCLMPPVCKNGQPVNDVPKIGMRFMTGNKDEDENILDVKSVTQSKAKTRGGEWIYDVRVRWNADGAAVQWTYPNDMLANKCRYFCD